MDDKDFYASFGFLNEDFTLNGTRSEMRQRTLKNFLSQQLHSKKTKICSVLNLEEALIFGL